MPPLWGGVRPEGSIDPPPPPGNENPVSHVILAGSQLIGGHTEYLVLCGLGVPFLQVAIGCRTKPATYCVQNAKVCTIYWEKITRI